jgi:hypothetical protein
MVVPAEHQHLYDQANFSNATGSVPSGLHRRLRPRPPGEKELRNGWWRYKYERNKKEQLKNWFAANRYARECAAYVELKFNEDSFKHECLLDVGDTASSAADLLLARMAAKSWLCAYIEGIAHGSYTVQTMCVHHAGWMPAFQQCMSLYTDSSLTAQSEISSSGGRRLASESGNEFFLIPEAIVFGDGTTCIPLSSWVAKDNKVHLRFAKGTCRGLNPGGTNLILEQVSDGDKTAYNVVGGDRPRRLSMNSAIRLLFKKYLLSK